MKKYFLVLGFVFITHALMAQQSATELAKELNKSITLYSADNAALLNLSERIGVLEQKMNDNAVMRINLGDIGSIKVETNTIGFSVNITCTETGSCIHIITHDTVSTAMPSTAFFFSDIKASNTFAKKLESLVMKYAQQGNIIQAQLLKDGQGDISFTEAEKPLNKTKDLKVINDSGEQDSETDNDDTDTKSKGSKVAISTKKEKVVKEKQTKKSETEENEDPSNIRTPAETIDPRKSSETEFEPICKQLSAIISSGKNNRFKDIEGKETNPDKKINESKMKLKGSKRTYISWYKNERAFIAEFKTSNDNELILIEFDKLQTQLEDCLEGYWEDTDHSNDDIYANVKDEVKDVEYKFNADAKTPTMRIMIHTEGEKHTLFVRIR